ncbi:MAG TPA: hypothetical protein VGK30_03555 [Candidatus Binatia bacterium]|jgi:hypothetical protein
MAQPASRPRQNAKTRPNQPSIRRLLVGDALRSWVLPTAAIVVLLVAMLLDTLELVPDPAAAAIGALALLVMTAALAVAPLLTEDVDARVRPATVALLALAWVVVLAYPFTARLFPGAALGRVVLDPAAAGSTLVPADAGSRADVVVDLHLPMASDRRDRTVHYDVDMVDGAGDHSRIDGELGDSWRTRSMGRRGSVPSHLEHLSASHVVEAGTGGLRLGGATLVGEPGATAAATAYPYRLPAMAVLYGLAIVLCAGALALDRWWDPRERPTVTIATTGAAAAALVFAGSGAGHPGMRDLIGVALVGAVVGFTLGSALAWLAGAVLPSGDGARRRAA